MRTYIGDQGEVSIFRIDALPSDIETVSVAKSDARGYIISHSESGHHHMLSGGDVLERKQVPQGMKIFYAILDKPQTFFHDAPGAHEAYNLDPGIFEFRIAREYNPFLEEARQVQD